MTLVTTFSLPMAIKFNHSLPYNKNIGGIYMKIIEVKNISKKFEDKIVLDNISFTIEEGDIFGLICQTGAGKST